MKFYIAGKWEEREIVRQYADAISALGYTVSYPWFTRHTGTTPLDIAAGEDLEGVRDANFCVFVYERQLAYAGAFAELGAALAYGRQIYIIGDAGNRCVFAHHPMVVHVPSLSALLELLARRAAPSTRD